MRVSFYTYLIIGLFFVCNSCSFKQDQILFEQRNSIPDSILQKNIANIRNYRIKPQDLLQIRNLQNIKTIVDLNPTIGTVPALATFTTTSEPYLVEDDGTVGLTGLGHIPVAGLTRLEATALIEKLYHEQYLKDVIIDLRITNLKVTVLGEIKSQGNFTLMKDKTSLVEMIGEAGGLTEKADEKNVKIIRGQTAPVVIQVDLSDIKSIANPVILQSGDVIYIAENKRAIRADKNQTFSNLIQPVLLVFSTVLLVITLARR